MKTKRAVFAFAFMGSLYWTALIWADSKNQVFASIPRLLSIMPLLLGASLLSYAVRYVRWYWLLKKAGHKLPPFQGFVAYLSGFTFTATPGKVGELLRIRYFAPHGVPPWKVLGAFVYERAFDLLSVLLLSSLFIRRMDFFILAVSFVCIFLGIVSFAVFQPRQMTRILGCLRAWRAKRLARILKTLRDGLVGCRLWLNPRDALVSLGLGITAWGLTALSFVCLLHHLEIALPFTSSIAAYPLAMLAGAASMLPGGVGSTEATLVALLSTHEVALPVAMLATVGIRLSTLWFAMLCGLLSLFSLEFFSKRNLKQPL